jgi:hypothetical protein
MPLHASIGATLVVSNLPQAWPCSSLTVSTADGDSQGDAEALRRRRTILMSTRLTSVPSASKGGLSVGNQAPACRAPAHLQIARCPRGARFSPLTRLAKTAQLQLPCQVSIAAFVPRTGPADRFHCKGANGSRHLYVRRRLRTAQGECPHTRTSDKHPRKGLLSLASLAFPIAGCGGGCGTAITTSFGQFNSANFTRLVVADLAPQIPG